MYDAGVLILLLILLPIIFLVMGFVAFLRTGALRADLARAHARIAVLEQALRAQTPEAPRSVAEAAPPPVLVQPAISPPPPPPIVTPAPIPVPEKERVPILGRIEKALASNWFVWIGGLLIAAAIVALLQFAVQEGYFGPPQQLACAYLLGVALIGAAEWVRRRPPGVALAHTQLVHLPAILAAAGLFAWFTATFAGYANLNVIGVRVAFVLMALSSLAAIVAALRFGKWLAALGLTGGYLAPALVHFPNPSPAALFGYLLALTAASLAVIRLRKWKGFVWLAGFGALLWGLAWTQDIFADAAAHQAAAFYIVALAILGWAFAWSNARKPLRFDTIEAHVDHWSEPMLAAHVMALAAGLDLFSLNDHVGYEIPVLIAILALCVLACLTAYVREGFALIAVAGAILGAATIYNWPMAGPDDNAIPMGISHFFSFCGAFGFIFSAGGWLMMTANRTKTPGAALAALGPLLIVLVSHDKAALLREPIYWSAASLMLAALNLFALERLAKAYDGLDKAPGPSAAFALGASAGVIMALLFGFTGQVLWGAAALALLAPVMAWLDLRFKLPALRVAASIVALIVVWTLGPSLRVFFTPLSHAPLINPILPVYGAAVAAFWGAATIYRRGGASETAPIVQALEASALVLAALGVSLEIRHLTTGGDLGAWGMSLMEISGDIIAWLGFALGLAARYGGKPRPVIRWFETIVFAGASFAAIWALALWFNPWWGAEPARIPGQPVFNLLLAAYGMPAVLFAAYAITRRHQGLTRRAAIAGAVATALVFLNITLELRRLYHPGDMASAAVSPLEAWSYTFAWIALAAALLALGLIRRQPSLRYASLIVLLAAIIKAFGFDMHALNGILLAAQLLGLGVSVIGVTLIYQRFVAPSRAGGDPNIIPPR